MSSIHPILPASVTAWLLLLLLLLVLVGDVRATVAPNHFVGTCLTEQWVTAMETTLKVDSRARDSQDRLAHPFLHAAVEHALNTVDDPRTASANAFAASCQPSAAKMYGVDTIMDATTGVVQDRGRVNGTLVLELSGWLTHSLTTLVFAILAREVYGVPVSMYHDTSTVEMPERMSSNNKFGECTPTHLNLETWLHPTTLLESYAAGDVGYVGRSGLYTTVDFVQDSMNTTTHTDPLFADFWKGYKFYEELISAVPVSALRNNSAFFPPTEPTCANGSFACTNYCSKSAACVDREAQGKECMVVAMMYDYFDPAYLQAALTNIGLATYFCFIGYDGVQNFALDAQANKRPVLFYHYEPDLFHINHPGLFERVFLPRATPERVVLATGLFSDSNSSDNPVDVDFPTTKLAKYASSVVTTTQRTSQLVSKFSISELHLNDLLRRYRTASLDSSDVDPTFSAACSWIRTNYAEWTKWLDRKPLCELSEHAHYDLMGCQHDDDNHTNHADNFRTITFAWNLPDPENASLAYDCDGGLQALPKPIQTSRMCEWIQADPSKWLSWIKSKPLCDGSFYMYNITACDSHAKRTVRYWWLLPHAADPSMSRECTGGEQLPADIRVDCDYLPTNSPVFLGVLVLDGIVLVLLVSAIAFVVYNRDMPIIKRSQWEFLALVVFGGVTMCVAALLYAGRPTHLLCGARPVSIALGFTIIFGALFVKSLRVYRVFMKSSFKKATITSAMMVKVFMVLIIVDVAILGVWFAVDFPEPTIEYKPAREFRGEIDHIACRSGSFLFNALLVFWKSIVLFMGIYASFLIRNVSSDFQESIWMFASSVMVLLGCLVVLPLAYLVEMPAAVFYVFLAGCLLLCTSLVMSFMLVPKILRLHADATSSGSSNYSSTQPSTKSSKVADSSRSTRKLVATSGKYAKSPSKLVASGSKPRLLPVADSPPLLHDTSSGVASSSTTG